MRFAAAWVCCPICAVRRTDAGVIAITFSGDGTGCKNIQLDSRYITTIPQNDAGPTNYFVGIKGEVNHTTATQLAGWKTVVDQLCATRNDSPQGKVQPVDPLKSGKNSPGTSAIMLQTRRRFPPGWRKQAGPER